MNASLVARALRSLRRSPGFVAIAALSLGIALGLSTSVFALIDAMTHPASPFRDVDRLYQVWIFTHSARQPSRQELQEGLAGIDGIERVSTVIFGVDEVQAGESVDQLRVAWYRPGLTELLGIRPRLGRLPTPDEAPRQSVALVTDALWRRRFGNRTSLKGATVSIREHQFAVVGVLPAGGEKGWLSDVLIPDPAPDTRGFGVPYVKLRPGADTTQVQAQLNAILKRLSLAYLNANEAPFAGRLESLKPDPLQIKDFHKAMIGAAICVLLIACANVAALMLARGIARRRDYALRLALGAESREIFREVLLEVVVLAIAGSFVGAIIATWTVDLMTAATPEAMRWLGFVPPQWSYRVLGLSALAVFASIAIAGGFPAWRASRTDPAGPLKESGGGTTGRPGTRFRWLVMAELSLSMTLVVGASLMVKSVTRMAAYDFGYDARRLLTARAYFWWYRDSIPPADRQRLVRESLDRVRALPGVQAAAMQSSCAMDLNLLTTDRTIEGGEHAWGARCTNVSDGFFAAIGIPVVDGRDFGPGDAARGAAILDRKTARRLFRGERAIGRMVKLGPMESKAPWIPVVGVVGDQRLGFDPFPEMGPDSTAGIYVSLPSTSQSAVEIVVRPAGGATAVGAMVTRAMKAVLPPRTYVAVEPFVRDYQQSLSSEQYLTLVFTLLGAASLALGAAGLFSVVSYIASQRMREFAVRIALGATRQNLLRHVLGDALAMALGGTAVGAGLGMWSGFLLWDHMWGVYPVDAGALVVAEVTLLAVTMLACFGPAIRATRANPLEIIRAS